MAQEQSSQPLPPGQVTWPPVLTAVRTDAIAPVVLEARTTETKRWGCWRRVGNERSVNRSPHTINTLAVDVEISATD